MGNISDNIQRVKDYFVTLNIAEGKAYILANFPNKWTVPELFDQLNVETVENEDRTGYYFFTDVDNGTDCLFRAIELVESTNRDMEEKISLLKEKVNELKELFANNKIEKLRLLEFSFRKAPKKIKKEKSPAITEEKPSEDTPIIEKKIKKSNSILEDAIEIGKEGIV